MEWGRLAGACWLCSVDVVQSPEHLATTLTRLGSNVRHVLLSCIRTVVQSRDHSAECAVMSHSAEQYVPFCKTVALCTLLNTQ